MMKRTSQRFVIATAVAVLIGLSAATTNAAIILADAFDDVVDAQKTANTATFGSWDTVNGIDAPATSLSFFDGDDGTSAGVIGDSPNAVVDSRQPKASTPERQPVSRFWRALPDRWSGL